jgi:formylmethanofuran dehydrogenase subunit D
MELATATFLEENLVTSAFHQTLGDEFTSQQDNYLKHKARCTLELLNMKTVNVSGGDKIVLT